MGGEARQSVSGPWIHIEFDADDWNVDDEPLDLFADFPAPTVQLLATAPKLLAILKLIVHRIRPEENPCLIERETRYGKIVLHIRDEGETLSLSTDDLIDIADAIIARAEGGAA